MNHIWIEFQDNVKYTGKMVSGYTGFIISPRFLVERHALGQKKRTWYYAEELKLETNTVLNSPTGIQFPKASEEASFLFRELWEGKNVTTLITLSCKTKAIVSEHKFYFWGQGLATWFWGNYELG